MAHGENANRRWGREYWSRRLSAILSWGRYSKDLTHRWERRQGKEIIQEQMEEVEE